VGLSEDQKAMLRLLAQRGEQGYEDIAALKGLSVEEVRAQARDAVRQMEDEGLPAPAIPLEPSASSAPAEPAKEPTAATPPPPPEPAQPAPEAPAEPPPPPPLPPRDAAPKPPPGETTPPARHAKPKPGLPKDPGARAAIAVGLIAVVAIVVILLVGGGGGSGSSTTSGTAGSETAAEGTTSPTSSKELTQAILNPVAGGEGEGKAIFGRVKNKLALQVEATGLQPTEQGQAYTIWLAASPQKMLPLANAQTDRKGRIAAQFQVPTEVLAYLANETFGQIVVSRTSVALLKAALKKASSEKKAPIYTGTHVLEGTVTGPIVGAAKRLEEEKAGR
jgi:hypothetical protein